MAAEGGLADGAEEIAEGFVAEEVHALIGDFEFGVGVVALAGGALAFGGFFGVEVGFVLHALDDLVDEFFDLRRVQLLELLLGVVVEEFAGFKGLADGLAEAFHGVVRVLEGRVGVLEAGVEEEVRQGLQEVFEVYARGEVAGELGVAREFHAVSRLDA